MARPNLPTEIRLRIFECCLSVSDAVHLARADRAFNDTWSYYIRPICESILSSTIDHYDDAKILVEAQEDGSLPTIQQHVLSFFSNAQVVNRACHAIIRTYVYQVTLPTLVRTGHTNEVVIVQLAPRERARFATAYYGIWALSIALRQCKDPCNKNTVTKIATDLFSTKTDYELWRMERLLLVLNKCTNNMDRESLGMNGNEFMVENYDRDWPQHWLMAESLPDPNLFPWESAEFVLNRVVADRFPGGNKNFGGCG
ncbi:MAG: hypothetical protein L6R40_007395 [Gallowayella cf. fulva]|nr:MAG: hypothetical protein L6R40_007395 [Xanthomendoza cf. fulva]